MAKAQDLVKQDLLKQELLKQGEALTDPPEAFKNTLSQAENNIYSAFNDDFATPKAFAVLFFVLNAFQKVIQTGSVSQKASSAKKYLDFFKKQGSIMGLFQEDPAVFLQQLEEKLLKQKNLKPEMIDKLVGERTLARKHKDFKKADQLRQKLDSMGIELKDSPKGSEWEV